MTDLLAFLERGGYRTEPVGTDSVEAAPWPRSLAIERARIDLVLYLRAWETQHGDVRAEVEEV